VRADADPWGGLAAPAPILLLVDLPLPPPLFLSPLRALALPDLQLICNTDRPVSCFVRHQRGAVARRSSTKDYVARGEGLTSVSVHGEVRDDRGVELDLRDLERAGDREVLEVAQAAPQLRRHGAELLLDDPGGQRRGALV